MFAPNIRGSSGFGREFVHADDVHGRYDAFSDVLACADHLVSLGLDEERIAVTGRSYGGYLTLASLAFSPGVFAAGVDICGMSDLVTFYRDTEPWIGAAAVTKYGHPERDRALLEDISPLASAGGIDVPLLVVHGEHDTNVPIGEAHQIVGALRALGGRWSTWSCPARARLPAGDVPQGAGRRDDPLPAHAPATGLSRPAVRPASAPGPPPGRSVRTVLTAALRASSRIGPVSHICRAARRRPARRRLRPRRAEVQDRRPPARDDRLPAGRPAPSRPSPAALPSPATVFRDSCASSSISTSPVSRRAASRS